MFVEPNGIRRQILVREILPIIRLQMKRPSNQRLSHPLVRLRDAFARHAGLFVAEVDGEADAGEEEEEAGGPAEGAEGVARFGFFYCFVTATGGGGERAGVVVG